MRKIIPWLLGILALFALAVVAITLILSDNELSACDKPGSGQGCPVADAIVAVSGGDTAARTRKAVELYRAGWAPKLIFSGDTADPDAVSNAAQMRQIALGLKVPARDILIEEKSTTTAENARYTIEILKQLGAKKVILVSSPYHTRRVKLNFVHADDTSAMTFLTAAADDSSWNHWYLHLSGWRIALNELAGLAAIGVSTK